jgi:hypothetical protein
MPANLVAINKLAADIGCNPRTIKRALKKRKPPVPIKYLGTVATIERENWDALCADLPTTKDVPCQKGGTDAAKEKRKEDRQKDGTDAATKEDRQ